jgi:MoxR-like ATPase
MTWSDTTIDIINRLKTIQRTLKDTFVGRDTAIELLTLATVSQEHMLLIGPPGTAKTEILTRYTEMVEAKGFHYLLTRFTEPSEIFGPLDLERFRAGTFHIRTEGMLPEAQIAFLDEVFQAGSAILNTLLTLVHERVYHNGPDRQRVPLISLIGASNLLPDDPVLRAFADRFILRLQVEPVGDDHLEDLLVQGWELELRRIKAQSGGEADQVVMPIRADELVALHGRLAEVDLTQVRPVYQAVMSELKAEGVELSDRRVTKGLKLVATAALLRKESVAGPEDLWPLLHIWSRVEEIDSVRRLVQPRVTEAGGPAFNISRPVDEILEDLAVLEAQEASLRTEAQLGAHLMALNKLRREVLRDHRQNTEALKRVEGAVQRSLGRLEGVHV